MRQFTSEEVAEAIGGLDQWAKKCHQASLAFVNSPQAPDGARVARGWCKGVSSQHSWVALGSPYDPSTVIIDPTLWSYQNTDPVVYIGTTESLGFGHRPHGDGSIWDYGCPVCGDGEPVFLEGLDSEAEMFLSMINPKGLDREGWGNLLRSPVIGWPAKPIIEAAYKDERLTCLIPIDIVGMVTDLNPQGLYMRAEGA